MQFVELLLRRGAKVKIKDHVNSNRFIYRSPLSNYLQYGRSPADENYSEEMRSILQDTMGGLIYIDMSSEAACDCLTAEILHIAFDSIDRIASSTLIDTCVNALVFQSLFLTNTRIMVDIVNSQ